MTSYNWIFKNYSLSESVPKKIEEALEELRIKKLKE